VLILYPPPPPPPPSSTCLHALTHPAHPPSALYTDILAQEEVKAATSELERLVQEGVFEAQDCGLLHGQMPPEEKDAVLRRFKCGDIQVLVR
jgi:hypothetical protein